MHTSPPLLKEAEMEVTTVNTPTTPVFQDYLLQDTEEVTSSELDKDAFLQLLVAQLRYQDPLDPSDPAEFMATTAQFTSIEKLDELTKQGENNAIVTGLSMASSLVGRSIKFMGPDDVIQESTVTSAQVVGGKVQLLTKDGPVDLETVVGIGALEPPTGPSASNATNNINLQETEETIQ